MQTKDSMTSNSHNRHGRLGVLVLAALGVVYGDIGTSPLYAFKEAFAGAHGLAATEGNVLATLVDAVLGADAHHLDQVCLVRAQV